MDREDVIRMAQEAWKGRGAVDSWFDECAPNFERFAALVAAAERERIFMLCRDSVKGFDANTDWARGYVEAAADIADGIRALT